jgi:hypothetical protein
MLVRKQTPEQELRAWVLRNKCKQWEHKLKERGYPPGYVCKKIDDPLLHLPADRYKTLKNLCKECPDILNDGYFKKLKRKK